MNSYAAPSVWTPPVVTETHYVYQPAYPSWPASYTPVLTETAMPETALNNNYTAKSNNKSFADLLEKSFAHPALRQKSMNTDMAAFLQGVKIAIAPAMFFGIYTFITSTPLLGGCRNLSQALCRSMLLVMAGMGLGGLANSPGLLQLLIKKLRKDK